MHCPTVLNANRFRGIHKLRRQTWVNEDSPIDYVCIQEEKGSLN